MVESITANVQSLLTDRVKLGSDEAQKQQKGKPFPLFLEPAGEKMNFIQLQEYFQSHHDAILKAASEYGAVMFKGFEIKSGEEWASIIYQSGLKEVEYIGGAAVRNLIVGNEQRMKDPQVVTTNESPPSEPIPFHHELAQTPNPPSHICFYCSVNNAEGGSTPLIRSDFVYDFLKEKYPDFVEKLEKLGVKYSKVAPEENDPSSALGRSWKSMYNVKTKEEAEAAMKKQNYTWEWLENNDCRITSEVLPAIREATNGNKSFYNQVIAAYTGWIDKRNDPKKAVGFGDGTPFPDETIMDLHKFMDENKSTYRWHAGQFVIVDNSVAAHSRQPFFGKRKCFAAIAQDTKPVKDNQTSLVLKSGDKMPSVGFGCWKVPNDVCADTVYNAIKKGYRLLDCACDYGNEVEVGQGLKRAIDEGIVKREDMFITSKLWNTYHRKEHVRDACMKSLKDLGLDYLDLYLIHFPIALKFVPFEQKYPPEWMYSDEKNPKPTMVEDTGVSYQETYQAMEELHKEGLVHNIGCSNINVAMLREVLCYAKVRPTVLQVELHPRLVQKNLIRFCRENSIAVTGFSSFASNSYVELGMASSEESLLLDQSIQDIGKAHNKSAAQVLLRWAIQRGTAIIPKSLKPERMEENFALFDFNLSEKEMEHINSFDKNKRYNDPGVFAEAAFGTFYPIYD